MSDERRRDGGLNDWINSRMGLMTPYSPCPNPVVAPPTSFVTKDSGERQTFATGMVRDSAQKDLRPDLLPEGMLVRWAELMGRGANKYGERNWEKAETEEELARFRASAFRHFVQWFYGLNTEEDHAAAVFFNVAGAEYVKARLK